MDPINFLKEQFYWLRGSGDNSPGGGSSKKLTALGAFIVSVVISLGWAVWAFIKNNWDLLPVVLGVWVGIIYAALRMNSKEKEKGIANNEDKPE
jgi:hypothetical protein